MPCADLTKCDGVRNWGMANSWNVIGKCRQKRKFPVCLTQLQSDASNHSKRLFRVRSFEALERRVTCTRHECQVVTCEGVIWTCHVKYEWFVSHVTYEWAMSHLNESCNFWKGNHPLVRKNSRGNLVQERITRLLGDGPGDGKGHHRHVVDACRVDRCDMHIDQALPDTCSFIKL